MAKKNKDKTKTPKAPQAPVSAQNKALEAMYGADGVNAGNALINKFLQPGTLGRVDTNLPGATEALQRQSVLLDRAGPNSEQKFAQDKMKAGLGGYTSPEYQASREQMMRGVQSNYATSQSQLAKAQARGKVYGAAGAAQQANLAASTQQSKDNLEQDLMVKNIDEQRNRLSEYGQYSSDLQKQGFDQLGVATSEYNKQGTQLRDEQFQREKLNIGQANAETAGQIGLFTGATGTALTQKNTEAAQDIQKQGIAAVNGVALNKKAKEKAGKKLRK